MASEGSVPNSVDTNDEHAQITKRRRTTERSRATEPDDSLKPLDMPLRTRRASASSRASDMMPRSATSPEASDVVRRTKTGRVSKAIKGQRVHYCDECGKVRLNILHSVLLYWL
jgi:hypothetical protein